MPNLTTVAEIPGSHEPIAQPLQSINSVSDVLFFAVPAILSVIVLACKETISFQTKRKTILLDAEIERQKAEDKEKSERIEYLEILNQQLLGEILSLNKMMERSAPLSLKMYEPKTTQAAS
jgi:hypothetical protein